ncbi:MAG: N-acetyltransferase [Rhodocyclaceae bacterium]|nr:N-acetyltransferase [Rhodocyclaceae bacterium]
MEERLLDAIEEVPAEDWDALAGPQPFLRHAFLAALEATDCATPVTGWRPRHLILEEEGRILAAMPMYEKSHSFGEFVFDWAWADAYRQHGLNYYPKWTVAIPFTPVTGPRLLASTDALRQVLLDTALRLAMKAGVSSFHLLFPTPAEAAVAWQRELLERRDVQFHWRNPGYRDFADFLSGMAGPKRRKICQERRRVREAGIALEVISGLEATVADWRFFYSCYRNTYRIRGRTPFLTEAFFRSLAECMPANLVLFLAHRGERPVAASLCVRDDDRLYGRYWGSLEEVSCLHFEACFYAPIEYCIRERLAVFEGGAQGEHKLARGFLPAGTCSAHWLAHPAFADAVGRYLERERMVVDGYAEDLRGHSPFR